MKVDQFLRPLHGRVAPVPGGDGGVEEGGGVVEFAFVHRLVVVPDQVEEELLRAVDVLRVLGDHVAVDHVLGVEPRPAGPLEGGGEVDVLGDLGDLLLRGAVRRDGVEDVGRPAGDERLVVGDGGPGEHLGDHRLLEQPGHVADRLQGLRVVQDHVLLRVLDARVVGPQQPPGRHVRVELLGQADAELDPLVLLDLPAVRDQVLPRLRPAPFPGLLPEALPVAAGVDRPAGAEGVELLRVRVVGASAAERMLFPVALLGLLDDVGQGRGRSARTATGARSTRSGRAPGRRRSRRPCGRGSRRG